MEAKHQILNRISAMQLRLDTFRIDLTELSGLVAHTFDLQSPAASEQTQLRDLETMTPEAFRPVEEPLMEEHFESQEQLEEPMQLPQVVTLQTAQPNPSEREPVAHVTAQPVAPPPLNVGEVPPAQPPVPPRPKAAAAAPRKPRKPINLERFIGENLINKIGIAILVLGIGFFVKYAIDQNWISEEGRVAIGMAAGGILVGIAHRLRAKYRSFSSVLVAGGISVFYFTIAIAFHSYAIFSQAEAFGIMVGITALSVALSVAYNRQELAVISILGGFASPLIASTGEGNYVVLFTYLAILNLGMLALSWFKKWNVVHIVSYVLTIVMFGAWMAVKVFVDKTAPYSGALSFATVFYLIFFTMSIVNNLKEQRTFKAVDFVLMLSTTMLYFFSGIALLDAMDAEQYMGLFTLALAFFNFLIAFMVHKRSGVDRNFTYLLIGLVLSFVTLAAPIQLDGNYITLFWAAEAVLLLWLAQRSHMKLLSIASLLLLPLTWTSLGMDWLQNYLIVNVAEETSLMLPLLNPAFATSLAAVLSMLGYLHFLHKESKDSRFNFLPSTELRNLLPVVTGALILIGGFLELQYQLNGRVALESSRLIVEATYFYLFIAGVNVYNRYKESATLSNVLPVVNAIAVVTYPVAVHFQTVISRNEFLEHALVGEGGFLFHYVTLICVGAMAFLTYRNLKINNLLDKAPGILLTWLGVALGVFLLSAELDHLSVIARYSPGFPMSEILRETHKVVWPILWGVVSFALMLIGMKGKNKMLRLISLTLFSLTLVKLFLIDIRNVPPGGKIAAFISLGVLLLIVSFMYQKLKVLIFGSEDDTQTDHVG